MSTLFTLDRFDDGDWAVLEVDANRTFRIPRSWVPAEAKEGDVLRVNEDRNASATVSGVNMAIDAEATRERLHRVEDLRQRIPRAPKGDVSL